MKKHTHSTFPHVLRVCGVFAFVFCSVSAGFRVHGQTAEFTQNHPGSHTVTLDVRLAEYPGRGDSLPVKLSYSSQGVWRIGFTNSIQVGSVWRSATEAIYAEHSTAGWTTSLDVPTVAWPRQNDIYWSDGKAYTRGTVPGSTFRVAQLFMQMPDGSTHEMRRQDAVYADTGAISMSGTFYSVDSSRMRYDSTGQNTGKLYLSDGTQYILGTTTVQRIDRNGNTLNYNVSMRQWTDTLGRVIGMPWPENPGPGDYTYSVPGLNNSTITYTLKFRSLSDALTPGSDGLKVVADYYLNHIDSPPTGTGGTNFPQANSSSCLFHSGYSDSNQISASYTYVVGRGQGGFVIFNPTVLTEIVLPNGLSYKFSYNNYGELDKVIYPTGAYERYQYALVSAIGVYTAPYTQASRGMISRWLSPNGTGGADESQWQYSTAFSPMTMTAPDGTITETYLYYPPVNFDNQFGYQDARDGLVTEERLYAPALQGGAMLRRSLYTYGITTSITNKPSGSGNYTAYRNARLEKAVSMLLDTGGAALAKTVIYDYIDNGLQFSTGLDQNASTETNFVSIDQTTAQSGLISAIPAGTTASRLEKVFLNNSSYRSRNILGLPTSVVLKGTVNGTLQSVAQNAFSYDESAYPLLTYGDLTGADYTDPVTSARGNVTTAINYTDAAATIPLTTHAQYDQCGNLRSRWDERGIQSQTDYSSTYKHAYATQLTSAIPDPTGDHGSTSAFTTSATLDFTTGLVLTKTDINGQVTSFSYIDDSNNVDLLNRLRKITRPDGSWTKFSFGETAGNFFKLTEIEQDAVRTLKSYNYLNPMGRPSRSFVSEGGTSYIATDTIYDQMGRVWKVSNPYRTTTLDGIANISHTSNWTTSAYDPLGRTVSVILPDTSVMQTSYQGVYTTVTDQAGQQRRQKTDGLGRVVRLDEPDSNGSLGGVDTAAQSTTYDYDSQGNLVHIAQGSNPVQHRYFKYDALCRLTYERQVEKTNAFTLFDPVTGNSNWTRKFVYDETINLVTYAGLLTSSFDARNVQTTLRYDNLNRTYQISYSDGTPSITNKYDQQRTGYLNNKGHLTQASTAAVGLIPATSRLFNFDLMGRIVNHEQTVGAQTYTLNYAYNLGSALTSETYPSGRTVNYSYDDGAHLSQVSSGTTTYASQFDYSSPSGLLKSVSFGNSAVEAYDYNSRLQLQSLDVTRSGTQIHHFDYKYGIYNPGTNAVDASKNTGQIAQIEGFIGSAKKWQQGFTYDTLGRLSSARELRGDNGQLSYTINYEYDLFSNRYQKQSQNAGNPFPQVWVEANQIDQATNRYSSDVSYDNAGNITVDSKFRSRKYDYDANNRMKQSRNLNDTGAVDSVFDAGGQRVGIQVGGSLTNVFVYDVMGKLVAEYNTTQSNGGTQYVFSDQQGSPRTITDNQGVVVSRHDYLPFGEEIPGNVGLRNGVPAYGGNESAREKYAGMEKDDATGMAHTLWRKYDSASGRWTTPDPDRGSLLLTNPQTFNLYAYVSNNPVSFVDPLGLRLQDIGVVQTNDSSFARTLQGRSDADFMLSVNGNYAIRYNLAVSETTVGDVTRYSASPAAPASGSGFFNPFEVWFEGHFDSEGFLVWEDTGERYSLPPIGTTRFDLRTLSVTGDGSWSTRYDLTGRDEVDPATLPDFETVSVGVKSCELSLTRTRHGHWFFGFGRGAGVSWPIPVSVSGYSGYCYSDVVSGQRVNFNDPAAIDQIVGGTSATGTLTLFPTESISGSLNTNRWTGIPTGSGTLGTGWSSGFGGSANVGRNFRFK